MFDSGIMGSHRKLRCQVGFVMDAFVRNSGFRMSILPYGLLESSAHPVGRSRQERLCLRASVQAHTNDCGAIGSRSERKATSLSRR